MLKPMRVVGLDLGVFSGPLRMLPSSFSAARSPVSFQAVLVQHLYHQRIHSRYRFLGLSGWIVIASVQGLPAFLRLCQP